MRASLPHTVDTSSVTAPTGASSQYTATSVNFASTPAPGHYSQSYARVAPVFSSSTAEAFASEGLFSPTSTSAFLTSALSAPTVGSYSTATKTSTANTAAGTGLSPAAAASLSSAYFSSNTQQQQHYSRSFASNAPPASIQQLGQRDPNALAPYLTAPFKASSVSTGIPAAAAVSTSTPLYARGVTRGVQSAGASHVRFDLPSDVDSSMSTQQDVLDSSHARTAPSSFATPMPIPSSGPALRS